MESVVEVGDALVCSDGIRYLGRLYTLRMAIQRQWFAQASLEGSWSIAMYYEVEQAQFFIQWDGQFLPCTAIENKMMDQERIHKEIRLFRQLKEQWLQNRVGNS